MRLPSFSARAAAIACIALGLQTAAWAATYTVGPSGQNYASIQDALNDGAVTNGDVISVTGGTSSGSITVGKSVTIQNDTGGTYTIGGGADGITINSDASPTIDGFEISGNSANGVNIVDGAAVTIQNCTITANGTGGNDSGIQITGADSPDIVLDTCTIDGNTRRAFTNDTAGAGGTLNATDTTFSSNGEIAIFLGAPAGSAIAMDIELTNCNLNGNFRGFQCFGGTLTMNGGTVNNNTEQGIVADGGFGGVTFDLDNVEVTGNGAEGIGLWTSGNFTIANSNIDTNTNQGIYRRFNAPGGTQGLIDIDNTTISSNGQEGIWIEAMPEVLNITGSTFSGNANGGDSQLRVTGNVDVDTTIEGSFFDWNGSAVNLVIIPENGGSTTVLRNSIFHGGSNSSGVPAILFLNNHTVDINYCTLVADEGTATAGINSGLFSVAAANLTIRNTIFDGMVNALVSDRSDNSWNVDYCLFDPTSSTTGGSDPGNITLGGSNVTGDPVFFTDTTGFGTGDFRVANSSPAVTSATDNGVTVDYYGNARPRPLATTPDIGAHESDNVTVPVELDSFMVH